MPRGIKERVLGREGNIVLVDFGRKPHPPAPRFPGASGLRERSDRDFDLNFESFAPSRARCGAQAASGDCRV